MSDIKECFTSRFANGSLIEADYSQLEVITLAHLSQDPILIADILSGVDLHRVRAAELFNKREEDVTEAERRIAKAFSFQLQYGSGYKAMAAKNKQPEWLAKQFITNYYDSYSKVKEWQESVSNAVRKTRRVSKRTTPLGHTRGMGWYDSETGRRYVFFESDNPYYNPTHRNSEPVNFSPTQMKNYPVQGFATGDIVPMMLGELFNEIKNSRHSEELLLINTVHDSVMFDCAYTDKEKIKHVSLWIKNILESAPARLKEYFDINFDLPLKVEVKAGESWGSLKKLDI